MESTWSRLRGLIAVLVGAAIYLLFVLSLNKSGYWYPGDVAGFAAAYFLIGGALYWLFARPRS